MSAALRLGIMYMSRVPRSLRVQMAKDLLNLCQTSRNEANLASVIFSNPAGRRASLIVKKKVEAPKLVHRCLIRALLNGAVKFELLSSYSANPFLYLITQKGRDWLRKSKVQRECMRAFLTKEKLSYESSLYEVG